MKQENIQKSFEKREGKRKRNINACKLEPVEMKMDVANGRLKIEQELDHQQIENNNKDNKKNGVENET